MNKCAGYWLVGAFVVGFLAVGVPYWPIPYKQVALPNTLFGPGLVMVGIMAAAARSFGKAPWFLAILVTAAAVPAVVMVRVAVETSHDPTSHNLWPIEVIITVVLGVLCASAGVLLGSLPSLFWKRA